MISSVDVDGWAVHLTPRVHATKSQHYATFGFVWTVVRDPSKAEFVADDRQQAIAGAKLRIAELKRATLLDEEMARAKATEMMERRIAACVAASRREAVAR
ncbi:MAG: hypothetical protein ABSD03_14870 [Vulcanimicrobiaceae bacterium]|jgi:hypothetical protein